MNKNRSYPLVLAALALVFLLALMPCQVHADGPDETTQSVIFLVRKALGSGDERAQVQLLRALRQMADPELKPLFSELFQSSTQILKIHGILGLAECSPDRKLDLERLASLDKDNTALKAEIVSAAMDLELLDDDQCRQLISWPGLEPAVKVVVAEQIITKLNDKDRPRVVELLQQASQSPNKLGLRVLAMAMLMEAGDTGAIDKLNALLKTKETDREQIIEMTINAIQRHEMKAAGPWALLVSQEPDIDPRIGEIGLEVALEFNTPGAVEQWRKEFESSTDAVVRTRLALDTLYASTEMKPDFFEPLLKSDDPFFKQIGQAGQAIAARKDIGAAIVLLLKNYHPIINQWALGYAFKHASEADFKVLVPAIIRSADEGPDRYRADRLDNARVVAKKAYEQMPEVAASLIRPILADPKTSSDLQQAILVGLIAARKPRAETVLTGLGPFSDITANQIALILQAKPAPKMNLQQLSDLALVVRGGGNLPESLRIQAGWYYLKITHQTQPALAAVLGKSN